MPECDECGAYVTRTFHRVFCDNDGNLHACQSCSGITGSDQYNPSK